MRGWVVLWALQVLWIAPAWGHMIRQASMEDAYASAMSPLPDEHSPRHGVLDMRRRGRGDGDMLRFARTVRYRQAPDAGTRNRILTHMTSSCARHGGGDPALCRGRLVAGAPASSGEGAPQPPLFFTPSPAPAEPPIIGSMDPHGGPSIGGTAVNMSGANLAGGDLYRCKFGTKTVPARFDPFSNTAACVAPPHDVAARTTVDLVLVVFFFRSDRSHHVATAPRGFTYYNPATERPVVLFLSPASGPVEGGTVVTVHGRHLAGRSRYTCVFGQRDAPGVHLHAGSGQGERIVCTAPPLHGDATEAVALPFSLRIAGADMRGNDLQYTYYPSPRVASITPTRGYAVGGDLIRVHGTHLRDGSAEQYLCRFGGHVVRKAHFDADSSAVLCLTPPESTFPHATGAYALAEGGDLFMGNATWTRQILLQLADSEYRAPGAPAASRATNQRHGSRRRLLASRAFRGGGRGGGALEPPPAFPSPSRSQVGDTAAAVARARDAANSPSATPPARPPPAKARPDGQAPTGAELARSFAGGALLGDRSATGPFQNQRTVVGPRLDATYADVESVLSTVVDQVQRAGLDAAPAAAQDGVADGDQEATAKTVARHVREDAILVVANLTRARAGLPPAKELVRVHQAAREARSALALATVLSLCDALRYIEAEACHYRRGSASRTDSDYSASDVLGYVCRTVGSVADHTQCPALNATAPLHPFHDHALASAERIFRTDVRRIERVPAPPPRVRFRRSKLDDAGGFTLHWTLPRRGAPHADRLCLYSKDPERPRLLADLRASHYAHSALHVPCRSAGPRAGHHGNYTRAIDALQRAGSFLVRYEPRDRVQDPGCDWERGDAAGSSSWAQELPICRPPRMQLAVNMQCDEEPETRERGAANFTLRWHSSEPDYYRTRASMFDRICVYEDISGGGTGETPHLVRSVAAGTGDGRVGEPVDGAVERGRSYVVRYEHADTVSGGCSWEAGLDRRRDVTWVSTTFHACDLRAGPHAALHASCEDGTGVLRWTYNEAAAEQRDENDLICVVEAAASPRRRGDDMFYAALGTTRASRQLGVALRPERGFQLGREYEAVYVHGPRDAAVAPAELCRQVAEARQRDGQTHGGRIREWGSLVFRDCTAEPPRVLIRPHVRNDKAQLRLAERTTYSRFANPLDLLCIYDVSRTGMPGKVVDAVLPAEAGGRLVPHLRLPRRITLRTHPSERAGDFIAHALQQLRVPRFHLALVFNGTRLLPHGRMADYGVGETDRNITVQQGLYQPQRRLLARYEHRVRASQPCAWDGGGVSPDAELAAAVGPRAGRSGNAPPRLSQFGEAEFRLGKAPRQVRVQLSVVSAPHHHFAYVAWIGAEARYYREKAAGDLLCFYRRGPDGKLRYVDAFVEKMYWRDKLVMPEEFEPGVAYLVRYEHRRDESYGCSLAPEDAPLVWGEREFSLGESHSSVPLYAGTPPTPVIVEMSLNGRDWHPAPQRFTYHDPWYHNVRHRADPRNTYTFHPRSGPVAGGTMVTVWGLPTLLSEAGAQSEAPYTCVFGTRMVRAVYQEAWHRQVSWPDVMRRHTPARVAPAALLCLAPPAEGDSPGGVRFAIRIGSQEFSNFTLPEQPVFQYFAAAGVKSVVPSSASTGGRVSITPTVPLPGAQAVVVRFGPKAAALCPFLRQRNSIECEVPPLLPGRTAVEIAPNGQQFSRSGQGLVAFDPPHTYNVLPRRGDARGKQPVRVALFFFRISPTHGPTQGGTLVTVRGRDFAGGHDYKCRFGGVVVPAVFEAEEGDRASPLAAEDRNTGVGPFALHGAGRHGALRCVAPPNHAPGAVAFSISLDGQRFSAESESGPTFHYFQSPTPSELRMHPTRGPVLGGTLLVVTAPSLLFGGSSTVNGLRHRCRFMDFTTRATIATVVAIYDGAEGALKCVTPSHRAERVRVAVSWNGEDYVEVRGNGASTVMGELPDAVLQVMESQRQASRGGSLSRLFSPVDRIRRSHRAGFMFYDPYAAPSFVPHAGSQEGGTTVSLLGVSGLDLEGTDDPVVCHFGARSKAPVRRIEGGLLQCTAPPHQPGDVLFVVGPASALVPSLPTVPRLHSRSPPARGTDPGWDDVPGASSLLQEAEAPAAHKQWPSPREASPAPRLASLPSRRGGTVPVVAFGLQEPVFTFYAPLGPIGLSPAGGPASGEAEVHIYGANFTADAAYVVRFGRRTVPGLYDVGRGVLVTRSPRLDPGPVTVAVSANGQYFAPVPGRFVAYMSPRLELRAGFKTGAASGESPQLQFSGSDMDALDDHEEKAAADHDTGTVELLYAPFPAANSSGRHVTGVEATVLDGDEVRKMDLAALTPDSPRVPYSWRVELPPSTTREIHVRRLRVHYAPDLRSHSDNASAAGLAPGDLHVVEDDNSGLGWTWQYLPRRASQGDGQAPEAAGEWRELPGSAIRGGAIWNAGQGPSVRFRMPGWEQAVQGRYKAHLGAVVVETPSSLPGNATPSVTPAPADRTGDGDAVVEVALNGRDYTADGDALFAFDTRYLIGAPNGTLLRLVPALLTRARLALPMTVVGRRLFDRRLAFDVSQSLGVSRDRIVVTALDPLTGVTAVDCVPSRLLADPTCVDLMKVLRDMVKSQGSVLYDGILTWALDPLFPRGETLIIEGEPYASGFCEGNPSLQTEEDCHRPGRCSCPGMDDRREHCLASTTATGHNCMWLSRYRWIPRPTRLRFGKCSNPKFKTKESCLAEGTCSDKRLKTRKECLAAGVCVGRPGFDPEFPYSTFTSMEECTNPAARTPAPGAAVSKRPRGTCQAAAEGEKDFNYAQFTTRQTCEQPSARRPHPAAGAAPSSAKGLCVRRAEGQSPVPPFTYGQFKTKDECEVPLTRAFVRGACTMMLAGRKPYYKVGRCVPEAGRTYPAQFSCPRFVTKQPCVDPGAREVACTTTGHGATETHCPRPSTDSTPDLIVPYSDKAAPEDKYGPPCQWIPEGDSMARHSPVPMNGAGNDFFDETDMNCGQGPPGKWLQASLEAVAAANAGDDGNGPPGIWVVDDATDDGDDEGGGRSGGSGGGGGNGGGGIGGGMGPPGKWEPANSFAPKNSWDGGPDEVDPCPCVLGGTHLSKCNWMTCGPPPAPPPGPALELERLKMPEESVSEYQAYVVVGGAPLWMTLETGVATTWVMSAACFHMGCTKVPLFMGMFIPIVPPALVPIDQFEGGMAKEGVMSGFLGHSFVNLAGVPIVGAPIAMAILDKGFKIGEMSFNHTGAVGLGFWEDNMPNWIAMKDPALMVLTFMRCGNIFYPVPAAPVPIPKPFNLWGIPVYFPSGMVFQFSMYFGDAGGCFFMGGPSPSLGVPSPSMSKGGPRWVMVIPVATKMVSPSWLFILSDVKVQGISVTPCMLGVCKATVHTGQFSISGPLTPMLKILESASAPKTCDFMENMPDVTFTIMGMDFTMSRKDYVIRGNQYGTTECLSAFTPDAQLIPGMDMWIFGDAFVRAFVSTFVLLPMRRVGFATTDHTYYEKNGCIAGAGKGPFDGQDEGAGAGEGGGSSMEAEQSQGRANSEAMDAEKRLDAEVEDIGAKRLYNWERDRNAQENARTQDEADGPSSGCSSKMSFREGACVPMEFEEEVGELRAMHERRRRRLAEGKPILTHEDLFEDGGGGGGEEGDGEEEIGHEAGASSKELDPEADALGGMARDATRAASRAAEVGADLERAARESAGVRGPVPSGEGAHTAADIKLREASSLSVERSEDAMERAQRTQETVDALARDARRRGLTAAQELAAVQATPAARKPVDKEGERKGGAVSRGSEIGSATAFSKAFAAAMGEELPLVGIYGDKDVKEPGLLETYSAAANATNAPGSRAEAPPSEGAASAVGQQAVETAEEEAAAAAELDQLQSEDVQLEVELDAHAEWVSTGLPDELKPRGRSTEAAKERLRQNAAAVMARQHKRERDALNDRMRHGVDPAAAGLLETAAGQRSEAQAGARASGRLDLGAMTGTQVSLKQGNVESVEEDLELHRNMSIILHRMMPELNVTANQVRMWWRGESEEYLDRERESILSEWEAELKAARGALKSFKIKSLINERVLRRAMHNLNHTIVDTVLTAERSRTEGTALDAWDGDMAKIREEVERVRRKEHALRVNADRERRGLSPLPLSAFGSPSAGEGMDNGEEPLDEGGSAPNDTPEAGMAEDSNTLGRVLQDDSGATSDNTTDTRQVRNYTAGPQDANVDLSATGSTGAATGGSWSDDHIRSALKRVLTPDYVKRRRARQMRIAAAVRQLRNAAAKAQSKTNATGGQNGAGRDLDTVVEGRHTETSPASGAPRLWRQRRSSVVRGAKDEILSEIGDEDEDSDEDEDNDDDDLAERAGEDREVAHSSKTKEGRLSSFASQRLAGTLGDGDDWDLHTERDVMRHGGRLPPHPMARYKALKAQLSEADEDEDVEEGMNDSRAWTRDLEGAQHPLTEEDDAEARYLHKLRRTDAPPRVPPSAPKDTQRRAKREVLEAYQRMASAHAEHRRRAELEIQRMEHAKKRWDQDLGMAHTARRQSPSDGAPQPWGPYRERGAGGEGRRPRESARSPPPKRNDKENSDGLLGEMTMH